MGDFGHTLCWGSFFSLFIHIYNFFYLFFIQLSITLLFLMFVKKYRSEFKVRFGNAKILLINLFLIFCNTCQLFCAFSHRNAMAWKCQTGIQIKSGAKLSAFHCGISNSNLLEMMSLVDWVEVNALLIHAYYPLSSFCGIFRVTQSLKILVFKKLQFLDSLRQGFFHYRKENCLHSWNCWL